jgi:hypothetical protein
MSEVTADANRLSFAVETGFMDLPATGVGPSDPGCLTSEDEERETWTAESLRISAHENLVFSLIGIGRKTSAVHVLNKETP